MKVLFTFGAICLAGTLLAQSNNNAGSPGPLADSCGAPAQGAGSPSPGARGTPVFPAGQYPVKLPALSLLGARNDLPNPFRPGVHWGQLPGGRKWGSTAGVYAGPDGKTIWAIDRCGASGAGGTTCVDSPLDPVLQFDTSGKRLQSFGKGLIVSPHKISVDKDGNVWVADNGSAPGKGQQALKFSPEGKLLMKLGKPGVAGPGLDEFDLPTEVAVAPNGDIFVDTGQPALPATGYGYNPGIQRGIRIGSARDGSVKYLIPDPCPYPYPSGSSMAEGVTVDAEGNVYGADFLGTIRKFVKK